MPSRQTFRWRSRDREVWVVSSNDEVDAAIQAMTARASGTTPRAVSLDLEYLPGSNEPGVISLSMSPEFAVLWHRPSPDEARRMPSGLAALLTSPTYPKVGFSIDDDLRKLAASTDLLGHGWPRSVLDIQTLYRAFSGSNQPVSMVSVVNQLVPTAHEERSVFEKMAHSGDWGRTPLTDDQIRYAAGDVFVVWDVLDVLQRRLALQPVSRPHSSPAPMSACRGSGDLDERALELAILEFLRASTAPLPRPERLRNHVLHSCPGVARLRLGERRKAAAVQRALTSLAQRGEIGLVQTANGDIRLSAPRDTRVGT
jgi:hypothetical protein